MRGPFSALHGKPGFPAGCRSHKARHAREVSGDAKVCDKNHYVVALEAHLQAGVRELSKTTKVSARGWEAANSPAIPPFTIRKIS